VWHLAFWLFLLTRIQPGKPLAEAAAMAVTLQDSGHHFGSLYIKNNVPSYGKANVMKVGKLPAGPA